MLKDFYNYSVSEIYRFRPITLPIVSIHSVTGFQDRKPAEVLASYVVTVKAKYLFISVLHQAHEKDYKKIQKEFEIYIR
jgi:hypothetical protein